MLNFPVDIDNNTLKKFEAANNLRLSIFEIGKKEGEVYGIYVSDNIECDRIVDLGFYRYYNKGHFVLITDIHQLLSEKYSKDKRYFCRRCQCSTLSKEKLKEHEKICVDFPPAKITLPEKGYLRFKDYDKMMWNHFCIFSDFECIFRDNLLPTNRRLILCSKS
jgi:hypothetical protein